MNEERRRVLQMLADGKITAEEAERLLSAMEGGLAEAPAALAAAPKKARYLRVLVDADDPHQGPVKVNVRVPMQLLRAGMRLGALIPGPAREQVNAAMRENGVPFDINQIKPENLEEIVDQLNELTVDVDQERAKVRVFCE
jgi:hypothetical protein